jgi:hypothetical protein
MAGNALRIIGIEVPGDPAKLRCRSRAQLKRRRASLNFVNAAYYKTRPPSAALTRESRYSADVQLT